jgi:hypothetical protein
MREEEGELLVSLVVTPCPYSAASIEARAAHRVPATESHDSR